MELGQLISQYISDHGMSIREFGRLAKLSPTQINNYIRGKNGRNVSPTAENLRRIATAMGITLAELIDCLEGGQLVEVGDSDFEELLEVYNQLNKEEQKRVIEFANFIISSRKE